MLKNTLLNTNWSKGFASLGGVVLGAAIILGSAELTQTSINSVPSNSDIVSNSQVVIGSKLVNAQSNVAAMERSVHRQINQYRRRRGLPPLRLNDRISVIARRHSRNMANKRVPFGHNGSKSRYKMISRIVPYRRVAENVSYNQGHRNPGTVAVRGWIKSPGHHRNLTGNYQMTGIGIARNSRGEYYFTQLFALPR